MEPAAERRPHAARADACARSRCACAGPTRTSPDLVLLLGDQVCADDTSEQLQASIRSRRDVTRPPGLEARTSKESMRQYWGRHGATVLR